MPHPSEHRINVRVQTRPGSAAVDSFKAGLDRLVTIAQHIGETFDEALQKGPELTHVDEESPSIGGRRRTSSVAADTAAVALTRQFRGGSSSNSTAAPAAATAMDVDVDDEAVAPKKASKRK